MPEQAYDLYADQYVEVPTEAEQAATTYEALLAVLLAQMRIAQLDAFIFGSSFVHVDFGLKPIKTVYIYDEIQDFKKWTPPPVETWLEFYIPKKIVPEYKGIYYEIPAREKFRGRALQANQPGDQPWKGKRK